MDTNKNALGQAIGEKLDDWEPCEHPSKSRINGQYCFLEPLSPKKHGSELFAAFSEDKNHANWTYLPIEPPSTEEDFISWLVNHCCQDDPLFFTVVDGTTLKALGLLSLMRINPDFGVIEVGNIHFSLKLQKTRIATEAIFLLMKTVFDDLGYRRFEWKCDNHNSPSKKAAIRFGFKFEGVFRQALVYKGRNRDTAWFSIIDREWPAHKKTFLSWLHTKNFDNHGKQIQSMSKLRDDQGK